MFRINNDIASEIKSRVDIVDLISSYGVDLKRVGSGYKALCPFHHEKTPSFHVSPDKGRYKCFGCDEKGDVISFVMAKDGLTYKEAIAKLAIRCGIPVEDNRERGKGISERLYRLHKEITEFFRLCLTESTEGERGRSYLVRRKLPEEAIAKFGLGYVPKDTSVILKWGKEKGYEEKDFEEAGILASPSKEHSGWYNRFAGRLVFPIKDKIGRFVGFSGRILVENSNVAKYINSPETPIFKKGHLLFALDQATAALSKDRTKRLIVCEGQIDVIRCHISGYDTAVASLGTSFTVNQIDLLKQISDKVVIAYDGDMAGVKAAIRAGKLFLESGLYVTIARMPEDYDPDSYIIENGADSFKDCLTKAMSIVKFQLDEFYKSNQSADETEFAYDASKLVAETISSCPNAVLKAILCKEAASVLNVPAIAIEHDLSQSSHERKESVNDYPHDQSGNKLENSMLRSLELALCHLLLESSEGDSKKVLQTIEEGLDWRTISSEDVFSFINAWILLAHDGNLRNMIESHPITIDFLNRDSKFANNRFRQDAELSHNSRLRDVLRRLKILRESSVGNVSNLDLAHCSWEDFRDVVHG